MYSKYLHIVINMEHFLYKYLGACCVATESFDSPSTGNRFEKNQCTFEAKRDHTRAVRTVAQQLLALASSAEPLGSRIDIH